MRIMLIWHLAPVDLKTLCSRKEHHQYPNSAVGAQGVLPVFL